MLCYLALPLCVKGLVKKFLLRRRLTDSTMVDLHSIAPVHRRGRSLQRLLRNNTFFKVDNRLALDYLPAIVFYVKQKLTAVLDKQSLHAALSNTYSHSQPGSGLAAAGCSTELAGLFLNCQFFIVSIN